MLIPTLLFYGYNYAVEINRSQLLRRYVCRPGLIILFFNDKFWEVLRRLLERAYLLRVVLLFHDFQRLAYAKSDSDVIAKMKGTFTERTKEKKKKKKEPKKVYDIIEINNALLF